MLVKVLHYKSTSSLQLIAIVLFKTMNSEEDPIFSTFKLLQLLIF